MSGEELMEQIISATFTRDAGKSESDFLDALGLPKEGRKDEATEVRSAKMKLLIACTKELLGATEQVKQLTNTIRIACDVKEEAN